MPKIPHSKFLITGGAGFIGSHLAETLHAQGHEVRVLDDLSTGRFENIAHLANKPGFRFIHGSVMDADALEQSAAGVDTIFHLAAAVGVRLIIEQPLRSIQTNVLGTDAVLKAAVRHGCRLLVASSSEVYGRGTRIPFREDDDVVLGSTSRLRWAYAASKMLDEFLALACGQQHGLKVVCARLFNTVGPRQTGHYGMVIPSFVGQALRNEPLTVYGDGTQSRCFCDVEDVVRALIGLVHEPAAAGQVFNVGATEEITMLDLAKRIIALTGSKSSIRLVPYDKAYPPGFDDMARRTPDISRIRQLLGWQPSRGLDEILRRVIAYHRSGQAPE